MDDDACALCGAPDGPDLRTLRIGCLYDLSEVSELLTPVKADIDGVAIPQTLWAMRICKDCRSDFMGVLRRWIDDAPANTVERAVEALNPERNIPVRIDGAIVMMNEAEWLAHRNHPDNPSRG